MQLHVHLGFHNAIDLPGLGMSFTYGNNVDLQEGAVVCAGKCATQCDLVAADLERQATESSCSCQPPACSSLQSPALGNGGCRFEGTPLNTVQRQASGKGGTSSDQRRGMLDTSSSEVTGSHSSRSQPEQDTQGAAWRVRRVRDSRSSSSDTGSRCTNGANNRTTWQSKRGFISSSERAVVVSESSCGACSEQIQGKRVTEFSSMVGVQSQASSGHVAESYLEPSQHQVCTSRITHDTGCSGSNADKAKVACPMFRRECGQTILATGLSAPCLQAGDRNVCAEEMSRPACVDDLRALGSDEEDDDEEDSDWILFRAQLHRRTRGAGT
jgi:hypothetical protein